MHLLAAQQRDDVAFDDALIAVLRAGLVALLGVVLHELLAQLGHRGRLARLGLGATGVAAPANLGQPVLCLNSCLFDGQLPVQPQRGLAGLAGVRAVLEHEHPRSEEHTSELQSLMRISYAVFCLKKKNTRTYTYKGTDNKVD